MANKENFFELRESARSKVELPIRILIGTQITLQGHLKDLSLKSAFIKIKSSTFIQSGDELGFAIQTTAKKEADLIEGTACVSRLIPGEGFVVYFIKIDNTSLSRLKNVLKKAESTA